MEHDNDTKWWEKLIAEGNYLRSIGVPVDDKHELAEWIKTYREVLAMPHEEVRGIMQRAVDNAIRQVERERQSDKKAIEEQSMISELDSTHPTHVAATFESPVLMSIVNLLRLAPFKHPLMAGMLSDGTETDMKEIDPDPAVQKYAPWLDRIVLYKLDQDRYGAVALKKEAVFESQRAIRLVLAGDDGSRAEIVLGPDANRRRFPGSLPSDWESLMLTVVAVPNENARDAGASL